MRLTDPQPLVVPILRAGLGMLDGMMRLLPTAEVGFLGMMRNEETLQASTYAERLPDDLSGRQCYVLDPMLATGGTLAAAIKFLTDRGADDITAICLLAAPEGCERIEREPRRARRAGHDRHRRDGREAQRQGLHRPRARRRGRPACTGWPARRVSPDPDRRVVGEHDAPRVEGRARRVIHGGTAGSGSSWPSFAGARGERVGAPRRRGVVGLPGQHDRPVVALDHQRLVAVDVAGRRDAVHAGSSSASPSSSS